MVRSKRWAIILGVAGLIFLPPLPTGAGAPLPVHAPPMCRLPMAVSDVPAGYLEIAREVVAHWPQSAWLDVTATGIGESSGIANDIGDKKTKYESVGLFQVRLVHKAMLERLTGSKSPKVWTEWLKSPDNNARAAYIVWRYGGMRQWGAWTDGRYELFRVDAETALGAVNHVR